MELDGSHTQAPWASSVCCTGEETKAQRSREWGATPGPGPAGPSSTSLRPHPI